MTTFASIKAYIDQLNDVTPRFGYELNGGSLELKLLDVNGTAISSAGVPLKADGSISMSDLFAASKDLVDEPQKP